MKPNKCKNLTTHRDNTTKCMTHHYHTSKQASKSWRSDGPSILPG